jgi:phosphoglucosamine mutase
MLRVFTPAPQKLVNIRYSSANPLESDRVKAALAESEAMLADRGRMVVRKSGTEPLIRVMAEALDEALMLKALDHAVKAVKAEDGVS